MPGSGVSPLTGVGYVGENGEYPTLGEPERRLPRPVLSENEREIAKRAFAGLNPAYPDDVAAQRWANLLLEAYDGVVERLRMAEQALTWSVLRNDRVEPADLVPPVLRDLREVLGIDVACGPLPMGHVPSEGLMGMMEAVAERQRLRDEADRQARG